MTDRTLNREILRLSIPSILANLTVPIVGMVDTALAGHLSGGSAAAFIGAISVGSMLLNLLYWNFAFLRTGTGGLTAQAFGRGDMHECAGIFARGVSLAGMMSVLVLALQVPLAELGKLILRSSEDVTALALQYFFIRIWAAPATISLMAFRGWFVGMQDSMSSMWTDLTVNLVNIAASVVLTFGIGSWNGLGFSGIPLGTVVAQYSGLLYVTLVCIFKYGKVLRLVGRQDFRDLMSWSRMRPFLAMNANLLGRSLCFTVIYMGFTFIAAGFGDVLLACSTIMMQLLMFFSYFTDGFAYAGEALSGRFIGGKDKAMFSRTVRYVFLWSFGVALLFILVYGLLGEQTLRIFTSDEEVVRTCLKFLPWLLVMPPVGCAAFTWDGIYLGATDSRALFLSMAGAMVCFLLTWIIGGRGLAPQSDASLHVLMGAYFSHLAFRTIYLSLAYKGLVLKKFQ